MRSASEGDSTRCAEGFGGAQNRANVAGVLHAGEDHNERVAAAKQVFKREWARAQKSGNALRSFRCGYRREKFVRGTQDERGTVEFSEQRRKRRFGGGAGEDGFEFEAGANRLGNQAGAFKADALAFGPRGLQNRAKQFQPMVFARSDGSALGCARRGGFSG